MCVSACVCACMHACHAMDGIERYRLRVSGEACTDSSAWSHQCATAATSASVPRCCLAGLGVWVLGLQSRVPRFLFLCRQRAAWLLPGLSGSFSSHLKKNKCHWHLEVRLAEHVQDDTLPHVCGRTLYLPSSRSLSRTATWISSLRSRASARALALPWPAFAWGRARACACVWVWAFVPVRALIFCACAITLFSSEHP